MALNTPPVLPLVQPGQTPQVVPPAVPQVTPQNVQPVGGVAPSPQMLTAQLRLQYGCSPSRTFSYASKQAGETNQQFGQRVVAGFLRALVRCHEFAADHERFVAEQATITQPAECVPEEVVA